jgi:hypothetical protein
VLPRRQPEPRCDLSAILELMRGTNACDQGVGRGRTDSSNCIVSDPLTTSLWVTSLARLGVEKRRLGHHGGGRHFPRQKRVVVVDTFRQRDVLEEPVG